MTDTLRPILFARYPEANRCKTRLIPALGAEDAADMHRRLVERSVTRLHILQPVLAYTGAGKTAFRQWLGADISLKPQIDGDLGTRMLAAMTPGPAIVVGSDIPDISADSVRQAMTLLESHDVVLGPAEDGGFWLIGLATPDRRLFEGVEWGGGNVLGRVVANAQALCLSTAFAETLADLDRPEDLARWPDLAT
ncbi:MAG: TIGR04282 family arsenosugar biosynthesis glycosyltransferase [Pacificimonas sp.]